jgi:pimeloyl-ACP methyl ester carboxylesterase
MATKTAVIFVHGFGSGIESWKILVDRLSADPVVPSTYSFDRLPYPTKWFNWNPLQRIPRLKELGDYLDGFLKLGYSDAENLILVGHSQGGLVIQSYLQQKLAAHRGMDLGNIRSVILLATPNLGSELFSTARRIASVFTANPQERTLRVLNPEISDMSRVIDRDILNATCISSDSCPIPFRAFYGLTDDVVPEASAKGSFTETGALPGGHLTINKPNPSADKPDSFDKHDMRYTAVRDAILNPVGHPAIFEVDLIDVLLEVFPHPAHEPYIARYGSESREVSTDNRAHRLMKVSFSQQNRCTQLYEMEYKTKNQGFVLCNGLSKPNQANQSQLSTYDDTGTQLTYLFSPERGETVWMDLDIYKGFDAGSRDWHDHQPAATGSNLHCKLYRLKLNLKPWLDAGFEISQEPTLLVHRHDIRDKEIPGQHATGEPHDSLPQTTPGVWVWEVPEIRIAVFALTWDIAARSVDHQVSKSA